MNGRTRVPGLMGTILVFMLVTGNLTVSALSIGSTMTRLTGVVSIVDTDRATGPFINGVHVPVDGAVTAKKSALPLGGLRVTLGDIETTTASDGSYMMTNVTEGTHEFAVFYGETQLLREIVVIGNNPIETKNATLKFEETGLSASELIDIATALPLTFDLGSPIHQRAIVKPYDYLDVTIKNDQDGTAALYFPQGQAGQAAPVSGIRFVVLDTEDLDELKVLVKSRGDEDLPGAAGPGNNTFTLIFGYEDIDNFWVANYSQAAGSTGIHRVKNGVFKAHICRPNARAWYKDNDVYQTIEITLTRINDKVIYNDNFHRTSRTEPTSLNGCELDGRDYVPGKVGVGGHGTSVNMAWFYKDITIEQR